MNLNEYSLNPSGFTLYAPGISSNTSLITNSINNTMNKLTQHKVAVFAITRNDNNEVIDTTFIKELWIQTQNGTSVDFEVARDTDLLKYNSNDLITRIITSINF